MKPKFSIILAASALLSSAGLLLAQTSAPTPTPAASPAVPVGSVYLTNAPTAARLADAQAVVTANASPVSVANAQAIIATFTIQAANAQTWTTVSTLAHQAVGSHGYLSSVTDVKLAGGLYCTSILQCLKFECPHWSDRVAFVQPLLSSFAPTEDLYNIGRINGIYQDCVLHASNDDVAAGNYTAASALLNSPLMLNNSNAPGGAASAIQAIAQIEAKTRAADALSWAKLAYYLTPFSNSQQGINAVTTALRATDLSLARANAFIAAQQDATQPNLLSTITPPPAYTNGGLPEPLYASVNCILRGDAKGALTIGQSAYIAAGNNNNLNAAVAQIASILRNVDGNLVRANAFVTAQKNGQTFAIAELQ